MSEVEQERKGWRSWFAPTGQPPAWALVGYMVGGLALGGAFGAALPEIRGALFSFGVVILFSGIGLAPAYALVGGALTTIGSVLMAGAPTGAIGDWAGRRLIDTTVGCAIALLFTYLLWPRDDESEETAAVPAPT
jgi:uncharacterized membrane protein YccC